MSKTAKKKASPQPNSYKQKNKAGRSNINILQAKRRCICRRRKRKSTAMIVSINIRKARDSVGKIRSPNAGTATSSLSCGVNNGRESQTNFSMKQAAQTRTSTTAATLTEGLTNSRRSTRGMLPEPLNRKVESPTDAPSTVKSKPTTPFSAS